MTTDVLRLRGGGNPNNPPDTSDDSGSMVVDWSETQEAGTKRGSSSSANPDQTVKKKPIADGKDLMKAVNTHLGWIEHTITLERTKMLTAAAADGMSERITAIRNLYSDCCLENSRLQGVTQFSTQELSGILDTFTKSLAKKCDEINELKRENQELKERLKNQNTAPTNIPSTMPKQQTISYASVVKEIPAAAKAKSSGNSKRSSLDKCRKAKTSTRFIIDVPEDRTIGQVKTDLWQTISNELPNPRARTITQGQTIVVLPDDKPTFEVLCRIPNIRAVGPRLPRVIIYDVDINITETQVVNAVRDQNPELGLTQDDAKSMIVKYRLGPRNGETTHWVVETSPEALSKIENKKVFIGLTRCRIKVHQHMPQCYKCQGFGHTALKCIQELPTCRHCANQHDIRECMAKEKAICTNCKGDHKASSTTCKSRSKAIQSLLRRTDFGSK